ncbi:MAG: NnrU family protein [Rhodobacteraceae bacterium]|nr:NnrU family protein [Paracoccaceae bacterium]MCY4197128.1 NnrU family protein [Paracoccaceae bacterium]MCY4327131.1 NnrU family protein [Paracoccaceae bacterium]
MAWQLTLGVGIVLWCTAHLFKRLFPALRNALEERTGKLARGIVASCIVAALILIIVGWRGADAGALYTPPSWGRIANNLCMLMAVILFGLGMSKSHARRWFRHPMLMAVVFWALGHLLVSGNAASVLLFGSFAVWAIAAIVLINLSEPEYQRYEGGSVAGDIRLVVIAVVVFAVMAVIHSFIGPYPLMVG